MRRAAGIDPWRRWRLIEALASPPCAPLQLQRRYSCACPRGRRGGVARLSVRQVRPLLPPPGLVALFWGSAVPRVNILLLRGADHPGWGQHRCWARTDDTPIPCHSVGQVMRVGSTARRQSPPPVRSRLELAHTGRAGPVCAGDRPDAGGHRCLQAVSGSTAGGRPSPCEQRAQGAWVCSPSPQRRSSRAAPQSRVGVGGAKSRNPTPVRMEAHASVRSYVRIRPLWLEEREGVRMPAVAAKGPDRVQVRRPPGVEGAPGPARLRPRRPEPRRPEMPETATRRSR